MSEEIRIELQGQFGYQCVRIQQSQDLGVGSYGSVYRATLDELPCAAKLLHATFFGTHDPGAVNFTARFEQECQFLSDLRHPCIVQFLGLVREPRNLRPILLMELMDESLTKFMERTTGPLLYHVQVNFIHDTALALAYLHSNRIIHRDLSSNNILLLAGSRAKVTDFGMSRMVDVNPRTTPFTQCPGTPAFMPPEALLATPHYSDKLDVFSAGVLAIQVMTKRFPTPTESKRELDYPPSPTGVIEVPVPERERRKDDLDRIASTHPLLPIALSCIRDRERERPNAAQLCQSLAALKEAPTYAESVQERPAGDAAYLQQTRASLEEKERENRDLRQQLVQNEQELQETVQELAEKEDNIQAKDQALKASEQEMRGKNQQLQDKVKEVADLRRELASLKQHLARIQRRNSVEVKRDVRELQRQQYQNLETTEHPIPPKSPSRTELLKPAQQKLKLQWQTLKKAPEAMWRGAAVAHHNTIYYISRGSNAVYCFQLDEDEWKRHSECPHCWTGLAIINELLTAVGGWGKSRKTNKLLSWQGEAWEEVYPPMNTARWNHAVVSDGCSYVIAAGGGGGGEISVEHFNISSNAWFTVTSLPQPLPDITATLNGDIIYAMDSAGKTFFIQLSDLVTPTELSRPQSGWLPIPCDAPVRCSTLCTIGDAVVAVGGETSTNMYTCRSIYCLCNGEWERIGRMNTARWYPMVAVLPGDRMVVVGGDSPRDSSPPTAVELAVLR